MFQKMKRKFDCYFLALRAVDGSSRRRARNSRYITYQNRNRRTTSDFTASTLHKQAEKREKKISRRVSLTPTYGPQGKGGRSFRSQRKEGTAVPRWVQKYHEECRTGHVGSGKVDRGWPFTPESDLSYLSNWRREVAGNEECD